MRPAPGPFRPPIILGESDARQLTELALEMVFTSPRLANLLLDEIERAELRGDDEVPDDVVVIDSTVEFDDGPGAERQTVQIVPPARANPVEGKVSVFSLLGAGLIGLAPGQSILWPDDEGRRRPLRIFRVARSPLPTLCC
jgi:regulator of nucleoside diphosphate kinase